MTTFTDTMTKAVGVLTSTGVFTDTQTIVIGAKTYTTQATLTDVDGNVHIGASAALTITNLVAAIMLDNSGESAVGAGTDYAASMTRNPLVDAVATSATVLTITARVAGAYANHIPTTETQTNASWGAAVMASGAGSVGQAMDDIVARSSPNSDILQALGLIA